MYGINHVEGVSPNTDLGVDRDCLVPDALVTFYYLESKNTICPSYSSQRHTGFAGMACQLNYGSDLHTSIPPIRTLSDYLGATQ